MTVTSLAAATARRSGVGRPRDDSKTPHIVLAVLDLIAEVGYQALRVETVASRAGVSPGSVYRRWPTKRDLVVAALDGSADVFSLDRTGDAESDFSSLLADLAERLSEPSHSRLALLAADPDDPEVARAARRHIPPIREYLRSLFADRVGADNPALDFLVDIGPALVWYRTLVVGERIDASTLVVELDRYLLDQIGATQARVETAVVGLMGNDIRPAVPRKDAVENYRNIIDAAIDLQFERKPAQISLAEIAVRAGVSRATLVRHIGTKARLEIAVHSRRLNDIIVLSGRAMAEARPSRGLELLVRGFVRGPGFDSTLLEYLTEPRLIADTALATLVGRTTDAVQRVLDKAREAGSLRAGVNAAEMFSLLFAIAGAAAAPTGPPVLYVEILLQGLSVPAHSVA